MIIGLYILVLVGLYLSSKSKYYVYVKSVSSLSFVVIALLGAIHSHSFIYFYSIVPGLIAFMIGDILLGTKKKEWVIYAVYAFLIGNIIFTIFFMKFIRISPILFIPSVIMMIILTLLEHQEYIKMKEIRTPIYIYSFILTMTLCASCMTYIHMNSLFFKLIMMGYILYFISDLLLISNRLGNDKSKVITEINHILYYGGLFLISYSFYIL